MKAIFKITALSALMVSAAQMAHAEQNANVEIVGNIVAHTCDLTVPQSKYDLGNVSISELKEDVKVGEKQFILTVKNCSGKLVAAGDTLSIKTMETGTTNGADAENLYGDDAGTNAGISLSMKGGDKNTADTKITPSTNLFAVHEAAGADEDISGKQWPILVTAAMELAQGKTAANPGALKANLQFTMAE